MDKELKEKLLVKSKWLRGMFMALFIVVEYFVAWAIVLVSVFQFIWTLLTGKPNDKLVDFTKHLNDYFLQVISFLTYNSEEKPFPFASWPGKKK
jgi:uncharacterized membrane protein